MGGADQLGIFERLPAEMAGRVQEKARALLAIPGDKRIPLMVRELKNVLATNGQRGIERIDPTWIVNALRGESPRVVAIVLMDMPGPVVRPILKRLPVELRRALPPKDELRSVADPIAQGLRHVFAARFHPMPQPLPSDAPGVVADIIHLERVEVFHLIRDLGLLELGQAFASVGKMALLELCRRLPREKADELISAVRLASTSDVPDKRSAQRFLARVVDNFEDTEEFFQKAGVWRLAKGVRLQSESFHHAFAQRIPRKAGLLLLSYLKKTDEMEDLTQEALMRLQDGVLVRIVLMAQRGFIHQDWSKKQITYHDPQAAALVLDAASKEPMPANSAPPPEED